jgi:hypothetical protein
MKSSRTLALGIFVAAAVTLAIAGCGGGGTTATTGAPATGSTAGTSTASATEVAQAKTALSGYGAAIGAYNAAIDTYFKSESDDAGAGDVLGVRNDAYDFRNAVYHFDKVVRSIEFPASVQADVNTLLAANKKQIAELDKLSQSESIKEINDFLGTALTSLADPSGQVTKDLEAITGKSPGQPSSTPSQSDVANALEKAGLVAPKNAQCAAQQLLKDLGTKQPFDITDAGMQRLLSGGALHGTVDAKVYAAGQFCRLGLN